LILQPQQSNYFRFLKFLPKKFKNQFALGIALYAVGILLDILIPLVQKDFIDNSINTKAISFNILYILGIIYILAIAFQKLQSFCFRSLRMKVVNHYYTTAIKRLWTIPRDVIAKKGLGYYENILTSGCQNLGILIAPQIFAFVFLSIQSLTSLFIAYSWSKSIGIMFTVIMIISAANTFLFRSEREKQINKYKEITDNLSKKMMTILQIHFHIKHTVIIILQRIYYLQKKKKQQTLLKYFYEV